MNQHRRTNHLISLLNLFILLTTLPISAAHATDHMVQFQPSQSGLDSCAQLLAPLNGSTFSEYLIIKQNVQDTAKAEFKELDNRNLAGTFYSLLNPPTECQALPSTEIKNELLGIFKIPSTLQQNLALGKSVREIISGILKYYGPRGYKAVLPDDIYPIYESLAAAAQVPIQHYSSFPSLTISGEKSTVPEIMIITSPLSPGGRALARHELQTLKDWLKKNSSRRLVLDTVYTFGSEWDASTVDLLRSPQVIAVHSFAKSWIIPGYLGFTASLAPEFSAVAETLNGPDLKLASKAIAIIKNQPTLPLELQSIFRNRWTEISPLLRVIDPQWHPPENGYLTVLGASAQKILTDIGYWTIPLSAFGSKQKDLAVISALPDYPEEVFYITTLSNLVRGYNKYSGEYEKVGIPESTYPDQFFLLKEFEISIGVRKAEAILTKTSPGDRVVVLKTSVLSSQLMPNERNGLGRYILRNSILLSKLYYLSPNGKELLPVRLEDALADSYALNKGKFVPFKKIRPRSVSILPIASACQACCKFCFSEASVSTEKRKRSLSLGTVDRALRLSLSRGAERAVITGGGEPTLIGFNKLAQMIELTSRYFPRKITLITNGALLAKLSEEDRLKRLLEMDQSGLSVLAISRHHYDPLVNAQIMGIDTGTEKIVETFNKNRALFKSLKLRLICVLQKSGVGTEVEVDNYINWARSLGVAEINFKELYVSTDRESSYSLSATNVYSENNRVYLRTVLNVAKKGNWHQVGQLPWGAPIFQKDLDGFVMQIAAYTEPSVFWERTHGIARSWNLMADGKLLVSLETGDSEIEYK